MTTLAPSTFGLAGDESAANAAPVRTRARGPRPSLARPGLVWGPYPLRPVSHRGLVAELADAAGDALGAALLHPLLRLVRGRTRQAHHPRHVHTHLRAAHALLAQDARPLAQQAAQLRGELGSLGWQPDLVARGLALAAMAVQRAWGMQPYPCQFEAAWAMLGTPRRHQLVEMDTGEGKSLAILLAAATAALAGTPVHVVTANDYLAARDGERAATALALLGLRASAIAPAMDRAARHIAYGNDVVYATARELGFDHLRDLHLQQQPPHLRNDTPVLRGLCLALIDEADSVLLDHARSPLVLAVVDPGANASRDAALRDTVYALGATLQAGRDYQLDASRRRAELTGHALLLLEQALPAGQRPTDPRVAHELLCQSLVVRHLLQRDRHYLVQPGTDEHPIVLIDETTGRTLPGTQWTRGLSNLVALKEGVAPPPATRTLSQITLQRFFARYWKLGGVSGTLRESRAELYATYRLRVVRVAPRLPSKRQHLGTVVALDRATQQAHVLERARACLAAGQPVLIGTGSVMDTDALATHLRAAGLQPTVLHARDVHQEAECIAQAGQPGALTVTTNLAGRGTDIPVSPAALAAGGLHVIACHLNVSGRIDRQLFGRTARNGQPGSTERVIAADGGTFARTFGDRSPGYLQILSAQDGRLPRPIGMALVATVQSGTHTLDAWQRWRMSEQDRRVQALLAFAPGQQTVL